MADIRIIKHEAVPKCGSFEVRFSDGRPSQYFYWEDLPGRRLRSDLVTSDWSRQKRLPELSAIGEPPNDPTGQDAAGPPAHPRGRVESVDLARPTSRRHQVDSQMSFQPIAQRCLAQRARSISESC